MGTLLRYELKKILGNKAGIAACIIVAAMVAGLSVLNITSATSRSFETGEAVNGIAAQQEFKARVEMRAGVLDDERVSADLARYEQASKLTSQVEGFADLSDQDVIDKYGLEFWRQTDAVLHDGYYYRLNSTLDAVIPRATSLQQGATALFEATLDGPFMGQFPYSQAEKDYWHNLTAQVSWPIEYGYADAWNNSFDWMSFSALVIIAICIALSGVFAGEYQGRTAAVILPTRRGKRTLPLAKVLAAFIFATAVWWLAALMNVGINVALCGPDGWSLPLQIWVFDNPYPLTTGGVVVLAYALGYVLTLGMAGFTLLLSSRLRSSMPVAVLPMAIIFLGVLALFVPPLVKVAALTPMSALNYSFSRMLSYAAGPFAADLPTVAALLYAALIALCTPLAIHSFRRHQVA